MKKKLLTMFIISTMVASLVGCGKEPTSATNSSTGSSGKLLDKKIEVTYFLADENNNVPITDDMLVFKEIEEKTNVKIKVIPVPMANYKEKMGTTLASGDLPDMMGIRGSAVPKDYGPQGAFVNLSEYIEKGKMPNLKKAMDGIENSYAMAKAGDGNIYAAPRIYDYTFITESLMGRWDILKKHNLQAPKDFDEFYAVLKKLKELYPDSTPLTNRWEAEHLLTGMAKFHHSDDAMYFNHETGKYNYGPLEDGYKETLVFLNKLYKEGLLDKEFATQADSQWLEKVVNGKAFFGYDYLDAAGEIKEQGLAVNPNFDYSGMVPPAYKGKVAGVETMSSCYTGFGKVISSKSKYKEELVKFIDWTYSPEGIAIMNFGKEGDTYTKVDGGIKWNDQIKTATNPKGTKILQDYGISNQNIFSVKSKDTLALRDPYVIKGEKLIVDAKAVGKPAPTLTFDTDTREKTNAILTAVKTYKDEAALKVVMGAMSIEEWDKVVAKMKDMKIEEVIKLYQQNYDKMYKK